MVHISKHSLSSWCWNSQGRGRLPDWHKNPSIQFLHSADTLKTTAGCLSCTFPSNRTKPVYTSWTPWSALKMKRGLWARPPVLVPVPSQAINSSPPIQTGRLLGPCFATAMTEEPQKKLGFFCLSLSGSLELVVRTWKHGCGPGHTRQPTRETTERDAEM